MTPMPRKTDSFNGGAGGIRTPGLCSAIAALSQLSYGPVPAGYLPAGGAPFNRRIGAVQWLNGFCL